MSVFLFGHKNGTYRSWTASTFSGFFCVHFSHCLSFFLVLWFYWFNVWYDFQALKSFENIYKRVNFHFVIVDFCCKLLSFTKILGNLSKILLKLKELPSNCRISEENYLVFLSVVINLTFWSEIYWFVLICFTNV